MSKEIVINLLAFADAVAKGSKQAELFSEVASLGVAKVEVRREWIKDFSAELTEMRKRAEELGLEVYYSIPAVLFKAGKLDCDKVLKVFQEAKRLGATRVKFAVGEFDSMSDLSTLHKLIEEYGLFVTVEGDQSAANGRIEPILALLRACHESKVPVYNTFDVGNFVWVGQEPLYNAVQLAPYVRYIHLKDVEMTPQGPQVRNLDAGHINWRAALRLLPKDVPFGIEFPCGAQPCQLLAKTIQQIREAE